MKLRKKLASRSGVTLVELLAAVMVLTLLSLAVGAGMNLASRSYKTVTADAEGQLLLSTAAERLMDELRYASDVERTEAGVVYTSPSFGAGASVSARDGRLVVTVSGEAKQLLPAGVYGDGGVYGLELADGLDYDGQSGVFTFHLAVTDDGEILAEGTFSVRCLNGETKTAAEGAGT